MLLHSNKMIIKKLCVFLISLAAVFSSQAQSITQVVSVMPPYSNKLSDYIAAPGKINVTINAPYGWDGTDLQYYMQGAIMSADESIIIRTRRDYKPAQPMVIKVVQLPAGGFATPPYILTYSDIRQIFDERNLEFIGITRQEVMQNGLPEGMYTICFDIVQYSTNSRIVSSCSAPFSVSSVEAPIIISPVNNISLREHEAKNVVFTWTRPVSAPMNTQYKLKIIELNNPGDNYQDKIRSEAYPSFFETTVTGNTYLYSYANPALTPGKTYAFVVSAIDPVGRTAFRNKGFSEVNVFTYQPGEQKPMSGTPPNKPPTSPTITLPPGKNVTPPMLVSTTLKGTLMYQYKNGSKKYPLSKAKIKLVEKYIVKHADGSVNEEMTREKSSWSSGKFKDGKEIAVTTTGNSGDFSFAFLSNEKNEPLTDVDCATKVAELNHSNKNSYENLLADAAYTISRGGPNPGETALSAVSASDNSCKLYHGYAIQIEGEHARYYLNPDQEVKYYFEAKGGETKEVGEVVSLVKTVDVNVLVTSLEDANAKFTINDKKELANMNVFLFRKISFDYPPVFPQEDVAPDKTDPFPAPVKEMVCVGKGLTDKDGVAKMSSLALNDNPNYQYYIYVNNTEDYNFESKAPALIDFSKLVDPKIADGKQGGLIDNSTPGYKIMLNEHSASKYFNDVYSSIRSGFPYKVELSLRYPTLMIELRETDGYKKLSQPAQVILKEEYHKGNQKFDLTKDYSPLKQDLTLTVPMAYCDSGLYKLDDLGGEVNVCPSKLIGPKRTVTVKSAGFADTTFVVKNGAELKWGERYKMTIRMRYGAVFSGTITDAETQDRIPNAAVKILGETSKASTTDNNGSFYLETRKLGSMRAVEISREGYMTDTVQLKLDKDKNQYYFELYRKARRLRVVVWGKNDYAKGVEVSLPDVPKAWKTDYSKLPSEQSDAGAAHTKYTITQGVVAKKLAANTARRSSGAKNSALTKEKTNTLPASKTSITAKTGSYANADAPPQTPQYYTSTTDNDGVADFDFTGGQTDRFKLIISNAPNADDNFAKFIQEVDIPYSKTLFGSVLQVDLEEGACLTGTVYLGETNTHPLAGVNVTAAISGQAEEYKINAKTDVNGKYTLRNLPVGQSFKLQVTTTKAGENFVGYNADQYLLTKADDQCRTEDFHMKTVGGVDFTSFLGFPFAATGFKEQSGGNVLLTGTLTLPANKYFGEQKIDVKDVKMVKSSVKNSNGDALLVPESLPFVTDKNTISVTLPGDYKALITDASGLKLDLYDQTQLQGEMKAGVQISQSSGNSGLNGNFGGYGYKLPDLFLASKPNVSKAEITVFNSAGKITSANVGADGFYLTDGQNQTLTYSVDGFDNNAFAQSEKSFFDKNGLTLQTKLKAAIANLNPSNVELDAGIINITKQGLKTLNQQPFTVQLGKWSLKCNSWAVTNEGVKVSDATLSTGVDVKIENLKFTSQAMFTDKATVNLEKVKLLGVKDVNITTKNKGLVYKYLHDGVSGWSLYAVPEPGQTTVATLQGMPGVAPNDKIEFIAVDFNSAGESLLALNSRKFRLYNIVDFTPYPSTQMYVTPTSLKLKGTYDFGIPEYVKPSGAMGFFKEGGNIAFALMDMDAFNFTHHNVQYNLTKNYTLSDGLFIAKGTMEEPGNLPEIKVTMRHTAAETKIEIDKGEKLTMGAGKELANLAGGIKAVNKAWDVLRFEGDLKGLNNVAPGQKMNFEVKGAVQATGQQIGVSDIPSFPGLSITYDMPNSRFIGSAALDMNLGGMKLQGNVTTLMDSQGWLFNASGLLEIQGIGSANLYGLFGNYMNMPPEVSSKIGNAVCLPNEFKTNLRGFFLSAGLTRQILPKIDYNYGIVSVTAGVDVSINARTYMMFGQGGTTFGLGVLAEGHAYLGGSCPATCTSANADAKLQLGISGDYNTKTKFYNIDGCSSLSLKISASQCLPVLVDCGPCVSVKLADFTIGAKVHLDNNNGFSMGLTTTSCDQQCK